MERRSEILWLWAVLILSSCLPSFSVVLRPFCFHQHYTRRRSHYTESVVPPVFGRGNPCAFSPWALLICLLDVSRKLALWLFGLPSSVRVRSRSRVVETSGELTSFEPCSCCFFSCCCFSMVRMIDSRVLFCRLWGVVRKYGAEL